MRADASTSVFKSTSRGSTSCLRLKASNCPVSSAARWPGLEDLCGKFL